jgi:hypothetical protein
MKFGSLGFMNIWWMFVTCTGLDVIVSVVSMKVELSDVQKPPLLSTESQKHVSIATSFERETRMLLSVVP